MITGADSVLAASRIITASSTNVSLKSAASTLCLKKSKPLV